MGKSIKSRHYQKIIQKGSQMERLSRCIYRKVADGKASKHDVFTEKGRGAEVGLGVPWQVWLESKHLKLQHKCKKIAPKWEGPFEISKAPGLLTYWLKLPKQWKIHSIFHTTLLSPYKENKTHGPNYLKPPPDLINGHQEYEVEAINAHQRQGRSHLYLVKWKGYSTAENTWEPERNLINAQDILLIHKIRHQLCWKQREQSASENIYLMPHIETLNLCKGNKENIPLSLLQRDLSDLTDYFDCKFKDYQDYPDYFRAYLTNWIKDPSYHSFEVHYCQHHLLVQQCKDFDTLIKETQKMREYTWGLPWINSHRWCKHMDKYRYGYEVTDIRGYPDN